ncbi:response regulator [Emticicia sp. 21SJ11W-3]|uniref:response regulator n=1 Tax=Emticicia sp. 21SJ11W-3 TaxID=2916755 RepID=UPI00209E8F9E|nr:response regulator [Emticicia sp. 21SJ11W-3]UTA67094.1 response regulator [Emticicia sp. 21SJ11W-3]
MMNNIEKNEQKRCVLLVDDDKIINFMHQKLIKNCELAYPVEVVMSGQEALDYLTGKGAFEGIENRLLPGLVLLDINMPVMDGWAFLENYCTIDEKLREGVFIVMLTSSIDPADKGRAEQNKDVRLYVNKPLTKGNLLKIIESYSQYLSNQISV